MAFTIFNFPLFIFFFSFFFFFKTGILTWLVIHGLRQAAKLKRDWNFALVFQIVQIIPENYLPCWYRSIGQIWWLNEMWFKKYNQKCTVFHALVIFIMRSQIWQILRWLRKHNLECLENGKKTFYKIKKIISLWLRWHILRILIT